jgi:hypothetical protein
MGVHVQLSYAPFLRANEYQVIGGSPRDGIGSAMRLQLSIGAGSASH